MTVTSTRGWDRLRLRHSPHLRDLVADTEFTAAHFIQPLFYVDGMQAPDGREPVPGLGDDNARCNERALIETVARDIDAGTRHFLLFAVPSEKRGAHDTKHDTSHVTRAVRAIKSTFGERVFLWVDVCLCSSTSDGQCAVTDAHGGIELAPTLDALAAYAIAAADAGADGVSPSDMMDGRTAHLRAALDAAGHMHAPVMSYSTKFASRFYGPFRAAASSAPSRGDRAHYQIDVRSRVDAIESSIRCAEEGADLLMVKPGMTSIDLIRPIAEATGKLVGAYQVSGEYAGLRALAREGLVDFDAALIETWHVFRRAGAAYIITYAARRAVSLGWPIPRGPHAKAAVSA